MTDNVTPDELDPVEGAISLDRDAEAWRDRDPISSLRDTEAEQGDEEEIDDAFDLDTLEAREADVLLDESGGQEAKLD